MSRPLILQLTLPSLVLLLACLQPLRADITVGTWDGSTDFAKPFGDGTTTRYQQAYDSTDFSGLTQIQGLDFYVDLSTYNLGDPADFAANYFNDYQVYLSVLSPPVDLGTTIVTPPDPTALQFDGVPSMDTNGVLTLMFSGPEFSYDPSSGDSLLVDIVKNPPVSSFDFDFSMQADTSLSSAVTDDFSCMTGCVYDGNHPDPDNPGNNLGSVGLVTTFIEAPSAVPEPSSLAVLAVILTGLLVVFRRRVARAKN
jgi:hypothetical protein